METYEYNEAPISEDEQLALGPFAAPDNDIEGASDAMGPRLPNPNAPPFPAPQPPPRPQPQPPFPTPQPPPRPQPQPSFPPIRPDGCINCGNNLRPGNNIILWTWDLLSPFFPSGSFLAHVQFYNATTIREPLDIYLNDRLVLSNMEPMSYSNYLHIVPGFYKLTIYRRGILAAPIIDGTVRFNGGNSYLLTVYGTVNNASIQMRVQ